MTATLVATPDPDRRRAFATGRVVAGRITITLIPQDDVKVIESAAHDRLDELTRTSQQRARAAQAATGNARWLRDCITAARA